MSYIGGKWRDDAPGGRLTSTNPATGEPVGEARLGDAAQFVEACDAGPGRPARTGRRCRRRSAGGWSSRSAGWSRPTPRRWPGWSPRRSASRWPRPAARCRRSSTPATFFAGEGRRLYGQTVPSEMPDKQLFTFRVPVGVAAIVTAGNFPVAVPSWYLVPALLCGNAVVWKPAEYTPAIAAAFTELFVRGGLPDGVLNTVLADGPATFDGLAAALDAGLVDKIGFTGSSAVGVRIGELAGRHLQNPCLELGGKNPLVVMPDADLDLAVRGRAVLRVRHRRAALHLAGHGDRARVGARRVPAPLRRRGAGRGDRRPDRDDVLYGPMISERFLGALRAAPGPGAAAPHAARVHRHRPDHRGQPAGRASSATPRPGVYAHPTIVDGVRADDAIYRTETFGPIVGVAAFDTFDEAVELANGHGYGLSAAIYTTTPVHAFRFRERVQRRAWSA